MITQSIKIIAGNDRKFKLQTKFLFTIIILINLTFISTSLSQENASVFGKVVDSETGEDLIGVNILLEGTTIGTASDIEGNFKINKIPPGNYSLIASMIGYSKITVTELQLKPGEEKKLDLTLVSEAYQTEEVIISARLILDNDASLLKNRQKSITVSDAIGSDMIKQSGSDDAGDALKKVVGTSVVDGKYVFVRGLGDRYSSTQLNGAELPSSDPNRKSFQMDLIPANLLDNIVTLKTFTPDKPGNFSGGIVDIGTKSFPEKFTLKVSSGTTYNSQSTGNANYLTYQGGENDWLGIDDGIRSLPSVFEDPNLVIPTSVEARFDDEKAATLNEVSKSFNNIMDVTKSAPPVNSNFSISLGDNFQLGEISNFGYLASISFRREYKYYEDGQVGRYTLADVNSDILNPQLLLNDDKGISESSTGGLFTMAYNINPEHQIGGNVFYSRSGISTSRFMEGKWPQEFSGSNTPDYYNIALHWLERDIQSYQLRGQHLLGSLFNSNVDWSASFSQTTQNEPDFRLVTYYILNRPQDTSYTITGSNFDDPSRYFRELEDNNNTLNLNIAVPFNQWEGYNSKFKFGGYYQRSDRDFKETIITYEVNNQTFNDVEGNISEFFSNNNNGITETTDLGGGTTRYTFGNIVYDRSFLKNQYVGDQDIIAGYGMIELPLFADLKFIGGVRYEITDLSMVSQDPNYSEGRIDEQDLLPSISFIYNLNENMNLRMAATQTLARPTFREIAPFSSKDFVNDVELFGNPNLQRTFIQNYDLRWEWFLNPGEIVALSGFYKRMENPIEIAFVEGSTRSNPIVNYTNVHEAKLVGVEFETRIGAGNFVDLLKNFSVGFNLTVVESIVSIAESELAQRKAIDSTSGDTRNLQGQSPYTLNVDLTYYNPEWGTTMGFYYNSFGERLSKISANVTPDVFEQPAALLNFTYSQSLIEFFVLNLAVKNILNSEYREIYKYKGNEYNFQTYRYGISYSIGLSYNL
ncbi:MAG: TonB-dependent receptor domain-containing protein [Ignavibacteriales bacterium]